MNTVQEAEPDSSKERTSDKKEARVRFREEKSPRLAEIQISDTTLNMTVEVQCPDCSKVRPAPRLCLAVTHAAISRQTGRNPREGKDC
jgi:hypothetical protein